MSVGARDLEAIRADLLAQLDRCRAILERVRDDETVLALRDLLLDFQFESRALITAAEERLGAYSGEDDPRALAARAEELIEQVEALQDAWESRVDLLLEAGFDNARVRQFLGRALADRDGRGGATLDEFFAGLPADMDQTAELLDYAKRYLLSLLDGRGQGRGREQGRGRGRPGR